MAKTIKDPKDICDAFSAEMEAVFKTGLISVILYGSAVSGEYVPGQSDINFIVVVSEDGMDMLAEVFDVVSRWKKRNVATPLFLTEAYIRTSLDVFPIEYLNMKRNHQVVYGKDLFSDLVFDSSHVRLQCEREVKGKLLLLREAFLETEGKGPALRRVVVESMESFVAVFAALLYLKRTTIPPRKRSIIPAVCDAYDLDGDLFNRLMDVKEKRTKISRGDMQEMFKAYLKEIHKLSKLVDRLENEGG